MMKPVKFAVVGLACLFVLGIILIGKTSAGLGGLLDTNSHYLVTSYGNFIQQYRYIDGAYQMAWQSGNVEEYRGSLWGRAASGDLNGDGQREVFTVWSFLKSTVTLKKSTIRTYSAKITFFQPGAPSGDSGETRTLEEETTYLVLDCEVAYLDGPQNSPSLVVMHGSHLEIYALPSFELRSRYEMGQLVLGITVGDTDGDGNHEIVLSTRDAPAVLKVNGTDVVAQTVEPCPVHLKSTTGFTVVRSRVRNTDADTDNEIVSGGNNYRLMIWKYNHETDQYDLKFTSPSLGASVDGVNAGDLDGDSGNEVIAATWGHNRTPAYLWVYALGTNGYELKTKMAMTPGMISTAEAGSMDGDAADEVFVSTSDGLWLYKWLGGALHETYLGDAFGPAEFY